MWFRKRSNNRPPYLLLAVTVVAVAAAGLVGWAATQSGQTNPQAPALPVYGWVIDITTHRMVVDAGMEEKVTVELGSKTAYSVVNATPFNLSSIIDILTGLVWQKSLPGQYSMPGAPEAHGLNNALGNFILDGTFADIQVADFVVAQRTPGNFSPHVYLIKFASNIKFAAGTVSAISGNALVVTPPSPALGPAVSLGWDDNSRFITRGLSSIRTGQNITVIYDGSSNMVEIALVVPPATETGPRPPFTSALSVLPERDSTSVDLVIQNSQFDPPFISVPLGAQVTVAFTNRDSGVNHNFSIYNNRSSTTAIFRGVQVVGPGSILYEFTAPDINATYYFRCDVHPSEHGQFMVGGTGD